MGYKLNISKTKYGEDEEPTKTEYEKLLIAESISDTVEIVELSTGKVGLANSISNSTEVMLFYDNPDGSDDKMISSTEFNRDFKIKKVILDDTILLEKTKYRKELIIVTQDMETITAFIINSKDFSKTTEICCKTKKEYFEGDKTNHLNELYEDVLFEKLKENNIPYKYIDFAEI